MLPQRVAQGIEAAATLLARLAGIDAQCPLNSEVMLIAPPREGCDIMRCKRNQRVLSIAFGREKSAVRRALEQHDLIRPDAPIDERFAKIFGNCAKVYCHDDASVFDAGECRHRQQRLERKVNVGPAARLYAVGNEVETLQTQDVI